MSNINNNPTWLKLDNTAKIFPSVISERYPTFFRMSVIIKKNADKDILKKASINIQSRFPYYHVLLKKGFFWYFLERCYLHPEVREEYMAPCIDPDFIKGKKLLFRILFYKKRISVEFSHILTDGSGCIIYLKTLIEEYFRIQGINFKPEGFNINSCPSFEEFEDSYRRYFNPDIPSPPKERKAFHLPYKDIPKNNYKVISGISSVDKILDLSRSKGVSITEFLLSVYFSSFQKVIKDLYSGKSKIKIRPVRIMVPVNLRKIYPSTSMRNFFLTVTPEIDFRLGEYSLDEIMKKIHHFMRVEVNEKYINQQIARNVKGEKNIFARVFPVSLKDFVLRLVYSILGDRNYTSSFSNIGQIELDKTLSNEIQYFDFIPPMNKSSKINCSVISFDNEICISFGNTSINTNMEKYFFTELINNGIPVRIISN